MRFYAPRRRASLRYSQFHLRTIFAYWSMRKTVCMYTPITASHVIATIANKCVPLLRKLSALLHIRIFALGHFRFACANTVRSNANEILTVTSCRFTGRVVCTGIWNSSPNRSAITVGLLRPKD